MRRDRERGMGIYIGVENGNPFHYSFFFSFFSFLSFHYSCLENSMDRGAWCATVHEVTELDTTEHTCAHIEAHVCVYTLICVRLCMFLCVCVYTHIYACVHTYVWSVMSNSVTYIYIYICVYIYICNFLCVCVYIPAATFEREFEFTFN